MSTKRTLLLTSWFFPLKVIRWEDAITMLYLNKADTVVEYDEMVSSPSVSLAVPAVMRLRRKLAKIKRGVKFSRVNVFTRDGFRCQYCNHKKPFSQLTYDHVIPRARGGRTEWTNIVTACRPCNHKKGSRTTDETGAALPADPQRLAAVEEDAGSDCHGDCSGPEEMAGG